MKTLKMIALCCIGALTIVSCGNQENQNAAAQVVLDAPGMIIPVMQADQWFINYENERVPIIESAINDSFPALVDPFETTQFVTADYQALKDYIAYIDQESAAAGVTPEGLRIYFAATDASKGIPGRETVFMNPVTSFKGLKGNMSYAIATDIKGKKTAITVGSVIDGKKPSGTNLILQGGSIQSLAGDDFGWPPPPNPGDPNDYH